MTSLLYFRRHVKKFVQVASVIAACALWFAIAGPSSLNGATIVVPPIPGLDVQVGEKIAIPGAESAIVHHFDDGKIVIDGEGKGIWSHDGGKTWQEGPRGPDDKTAVNLGNGEVLSIARNSFKRPDGKYSLSQRRSPDNWKTVVEETAVLDSPQATTTGGDEGDQHEGLLMHHGAIRLPSGDLMATMFGNFQGDDIPAAGYTEELKLRKYRTVVVFSSDNGKTWKNPVTVGYDRQLARGADPDSSVQSTATAPAVTQEGFCEPDLVRAANGDIICAMRSGGRIGVRKAPIFPTPLYMSRSKDEGKTWTPPVPVADRGVCPYLVTLQNGVIVCAYARPGSWLIFSTDDGETWEGAFQFASSDSYCNLVEVEPNKILVISHGGAGNTKISGTFFTVNRKSEDRKPEQAKN